MYCTLRASISKVFPHFSTLIPSSSRLWRKATKISNRLRFPNQVKSDDKTCELSLISVMRRSKPKAVRPLSESVDYNLNLVEKLEAPALNRVLSIGAEERFKRSSMRLVAYNYKNHKAAALNKENSLLLRLSLFTSVTFTVVTR